MMMMMVRRQWTEIAFSCLPFCGRLSSPLRANRMKWAKVSCFAKMYPTQPLNNSKNEREGATHESLPLPFGSYEARPFVPHENAILRSAVAVGNIQI